MWSYRFANPTQKEVHLATLRDLMVENQGDQIAKTALSNAIALSQSTMVPGDLDKMIERTNRMVKHGNIIISLCFSGIMALQLAMGYFLSWANYFSAFGTAVYMGCLWINWRVQQRYYTQLKWLESHQLDLPRTPISLLKVN